MAVATDSKIFISRINAQKCNRIANLYFEAMQRLPLRLGEPEKSGPLEQGPSVAKSCWSE